MGISYKVRIGLGYENRTKFGSLCQLIHFVNISDTKLKLNYECKDMVVETYKA